MNKALYRTWRPVVFSDAIGQSHITDTLQNQIISGRLSHAYLFTGTRGTGKTTLAKILSRAVNCENPQNGNPCNICKNCVGILESSILDVIEIDAASNNGVDNIRDIRDEVRFAPATCFKRVYIIDEVHMLSSGAFNALLKTLEEPPEHILFILATTEIHKVPATIMSRCQRFDFHRIKSKDIEKHLLYIAGKEKINLSENAAIIISNLADGSMRDALSILDRCINDTMDINEDVVAECVGIISQDETIEFFNYIISEDIANAIKKINIWYENGANLAKIMANLLNLVRDILLSKISKTDISNIVTFKNSNKFNIDTNLLIKYAQILKENKCSDKIDAEIMVIKLASISMVDIQKLDVNISEKANIKKDTKQASDKQIQTKKETQKKTQTQEQNQTQKIDNIKKDPKLPKIDEDSEKKWEELLLVLKTKINRGTYTCMTISSTGHFENNNLIIDVDDDVTKLLIEKDKIIINLTASEIFGKDIVMSFAKKTEIINDVSGIINRAKSLNIKIKETEEI